MIKTNFKIIWREFTRDQFYSWIKIGGLALGISLCFIIALFIKHELSYDTYYKNTDRIYRIVGVFNVDGKVDRAIYFQAPFAQALMDEFPEIEKAGRFNAVELFGAGSNQIRRSDQMESTYEEGFVYADQEILEILETPFIHGNSKHALVEPNNIVITQSKADKFFPNENPVGKTMIINNDEENHYKIGGVIKNFPKNSHVKYDIFLALHPNIFYPGEQTNWSANNYFTYALVKPGTDIQLLEKKLKLISTKYIIPAYVKSGYAEEKDLANVFSYELQNVSDIRLKSSMIEGNKSNGDIRFVWLFGLIAMFILIIACINFINLTTAKTVGRAKEVGLKKTIGVRRGAIIRQFLFESMLYSCVSIVIGVFLVKLFLPHFNNLSGKSLEIPWGEWWLFPSILFTIIILGFVAGVYPSFYLSSFKPVDVLKGNKGSNNKGLNLRNALVVFQFAASIMLIIGTISIYRQMNFVINKKIGFDKEQVVILRGTNTLDNKIQTFKNELKKLPEVKNVTVSGFLPIHGTLRNGNSFRNAEDPSAESIHSQRWDVDYEYIKTLGMKIIEGRDFLDEPGSDRDAVIINQAMAKQLNIDNILEGRITNHRGTLNIIGVVEDFHFESIRNKIEPLCMNLDNSPNSIAIKVNTSDMSNLIQSITGVWNTFSPNQTIRYSFLSSDYGNMYNDIQRIGYVFFIFTLLAIFVACLGLFGLAEFSIKNRIKEIGVRKVNGAKVWELITMLNTGFAKWVIIAFFIATPLAWYGMNKWLENYAYKTELSWWIFALAGVIAISIALITVSWQSWRAASRNPVEALRYE